MSASDVREKRKAYLRQYRAENKGSFRRVAATLTSVEFDRLVHEAEAHNAKPTTHLKALAFAYLDQCWLVPPDLEARLDELLRILRGVGNNLNQLAHHSNTLRGHLDTREIQLQLKLLDESVRAFVTEPAREK